MITYSDVKHAIIVLKSKGHKVTLRSVREELGTGSLTTISHLIKEVNKDLFEPKTPVLKEIDQLTKDLLTHVIQTILATKIENQDVVIKQLNEALSSERAERDELLHEVSELEKENKSLKLALSCVKKQNNSLILEIAAMKKK